jgi:TP901 family phage tail tape measure protein
MANPNVTLKFGADTSDVDKKLKAIPTKAYDSQIKAYEKFQSQERKLAEKQDTYLLNLKKNSLLKANAEEDKSFKRQQTQQNKRAQQEETAAKKSEQLAKKTSDTWQKEIDKFTKFHKTHSDKRVSQTEKALAKEEQLAKAHALKLQKYHNMLVKNSLPQGDNQRGFREMITGAIDKSGVGSSLGSAGMFLKGGGALAGGIALTTLAVKESIAAFSSYEDAMADLSAITGVKGKSLDDLGEKAKEMAKEFGVSVPDAVGAFKLVISALGPDIAKDQKALAEMSRDILLLAKASGTDATEASASLTTTLNQFGGATLSASEQAKEMTRIMNVMAAGALQGAAEVPDLAAAMAEVGTVAHSSGLSIEQTTADIEILAMNGIKGSEAGTKLKEMLMHLGDASKEAKDDLAGMGLSIRDVNPAIVGQERALATLREGLAGVHDTQREGEIMAHLFGERAIIGARILMDATKVVDGHASALRNMTAAVTGTNVAQEQADIKMKTLSEKWKRFMAVVEEAAIELGTKLAPVIDALIEGLGFFAKHLDIVFRAIQYLVYPITLVYEGLYKLGRWFLQSTGLVTPLKDTFSLLSYFIKKTIDDMLSAYHTAENILSTISGGKLGRSKSEQANDANLAGIKYKGPTAEQIQEENKARGGTADIGTISEQYNKESIAISGENKKKKNKEAKEDERQRAELLNLSREIEIRKAFAEKEIKNESLKATVLEAIQIDYHLKSIAIDKRYNDQKEIDSEKHALKILAIKRGETLGDILNSSNGISGVISGVIPKLPGTPGVSKGYLTQRETAGTPKTKDEIQSEIDSALNEIQDKYKNFTNILQQGLSSAFSVMNQSFFQPLNDTLNASTNAFGAFVSGVVQGIAQLAEEMAAKAAVFGLLNILTGGAFGAGTTLLKFLGFAKGGYTGNGGTKQAAGVVHGGEFVFNNKAVKRAGVSNLASMHSALNGDHPKNTITFTASTGAHRGMKGYETGGFVNSSYFTGAAIDPAGVKKGGSGYFTGAAIDPAMRRSGSSGYFVGAAIDPAMRNGGGQIQMLNEFKGLRNDLRNLNVRVSSTRELMLSTKADELAQTFVKY